MMQNDSRVNCFRVWKPLPLVVVVNLMLHRRSIREFKAVPVEKEIFEKVIEAAKTSPMGLPPSDVNVLVEYRKGIRRTFASIDKA